MSVQEVWRLLSQTEDQTQQEEIVAQHREQIDGDSIEQGIQLVKAWTTEGNHEAALLLSEGLLLACTAIDGLTALRGQVLVAKAEALVAGQLWNDAVGVYAEARQIFETTEDTERVADCDRGEAKLRYLQGDYDGALASYQKAQTAYEALRNNERVADCLMSQGSVHGSRLEFDAALENIKQAQTIFEEQGNRERIADCLVNQGGIYGHRGQFDEALQCYLDAQRVYEGLGIRDGIADCLMNQGSIHRFRGDIDAALACHQQAQTIYQELGRKDALADCLLNQGIAHESRAEYDAALTLLHQAQTMYAALGMKDRVATGIVNQGVVHDGCGEYDVALECFRQAQLLFEELGSGMQNWAAHCLLNQGVAHESRGEHEAALTCFQQAQARFEALEIWNWAADCLLNQGITDSSRGEYDTALMHLQQAQARFENLDMKQRVMQTLLREGHAYRLLGQHEAALQCYTQAKEPRPIFELWYPEEQWQVLHGIAKLFQSTPQALDYYEESLVIIDRLRERQQTDWTKMGILHNKQTVYPDAIQWCLNPSHDGKYLPRAFSYTERAKARALLDLMDLTQPVLKSGNLQVQTHLALLRRHQTEQQRLREVEQWLEAQVLSASILQNQEKLAELSYEDASLATGRVRDVETIQQSLREDTALVEFYHQGETQVAFLLTRHGLDVFALRLEMVLPKLPDLRRAIQRREPLTEVQGVLAELFDTLFRRSGIWDCLDNYERLIIVPHGDLHTIPLAALYDSEQGQYLIEHKILSVVPSASILDVCRTKRRKNPPESCLWVYDPSVEADSVFSGYGKPYEGLPERFSRFQEVIGTEATIEQVTKLAHEYPWDVVHFYCHAIADLDNPMLSYLSLLDMSGESPKESRLRAVDIFNLPLFASLVVLGACETGVGRRRPGDDIISLTRSFFRAGTPSVLASLWKVPIRDTATILEYFYLGEEEDSGWLSGMDKASALQVAQQAMLRDKLHPYYWAGFMLYGDWN